MKIVATPGEEQDESVLALLTDVFGMSLEKHMQTHHTAKTFIAVRNMSMYELFCEAWRVVKRTEPDLQHMSKAAYAHRYEGTPQPDFVSEYLERQLLRRNERLS